MNAFKGRDANRSIQVRLTPGTVFTALLCLMTVWVFLQVETPLLLGMNAAWTEKVRPYEQLLHIHAVCGVLALVAGATQFSSGMRTIHPRLHRAAGYVYVITTATASPLAIWVAMQYTPLAEAMAHVAQAVIWVFTTGGALIAILARQPSTHQTWMARSYALTLTFVLSRFVTEVLNLRIPADAGGNATFVWLSTVLVLLAVDAMVDWKH